MVHFRFGWLICIVAFGIVSIPAQAQRSPEAMKERMQTQNTELLSVLELTEDQQPLVAKILNDELDQRLQLMQERSGSGGFGAIREKMTALNDQTTKMLEGVLTEDQINAFHTFREENRRGGRDGGPRGPRRSQGGTN